MVPGQRPDRHRSIELRQLRYFIAVADAGSFSGAASALGVLQPTVSQHIQRLEDRLHTNLFERHPRGVHLTFVGRHLLRAARRIIREVDQVLGLAMRVGRAEAGLLPLGFYLSLSAGPLREALLAFRRASPEVMIELYEGSPSDLLTALRERRIDLAFTVLEVSSPEFATLRLWDEPLVAALPEDCVLASQDTVTWSDLAKASMVMRTWESGSVLTALLAGRIAPDSHLQAEEHFISREALLGMIGLGFGATVLGASAAGASYPGVAFRPIAEANASIPVTAVWLVGNDNPVRHRFVAILRDRLKAQDRLASRKLASWLAPISTMLIGTI